MLSLFNDGLPKQKREAKKKCGPLRVRNIIASTLQIDIDSELSYDVNEIMNKFKEHSRVPRIEQLVPTNEEFSFVHVEPWDVYQVINDMNPKKLQVDP